MSSSSSGSGIGIGTVLFLVFLVLKLTGTIAWSWWWVTCPLWGGLVVFVGIMAIGAIGIAIYEVAKTAGRRSSGRR